TRPPGASPDQGGRHDSRQSPDAPPAGRSELIEVGDDGAVSAAHLPGVLQTLEPTLDNYGYLAVAGFVMLEDFGVPVPGETILILGAVYAGTGRLNIVLVGILACLAAILGANIGFAIGRYGGRRLVDRFGRYVLLTPERVDKASGFFERHG